MGATTSGQGLTASYPDLGTAPVPIEPCISERYFELERDRVFRRTWLSVGRVEEIPNPGDYFVRDLAVCRTSILVVRGKDGRIRSFHNMCSHRGNKLVWEPRGACSGFSCKFHGWSYDLRGQLKGVPDERSFFDLDKSALGLTDIVTDTWEGFVFVHLDPDPKETLKEYLAEIGDRLVGFPFGELSACYGYTLHLRCNWKVALDAFTEAYHVPTIHPWTIDDYMRKENPHCHPLYAEVYQRHGLLGVFRSPELTETPVGGLANRFGASMLKMDARMDSLPPQVNPDRSPNFFFDLIRIFPNFTLHVLDGNYFTIQFWPLKVDEMILEGKIYYYPPETPAQRFSQEYAHLLMRENWLEDTGTMEATQSMLSSGAKTHFQLQEYELLLRHFYQVLENYVGFYRNEAESRFAS